MPGGKVQCSGKINTTLFVNKMKTQIIIDNTICQKGMKNNILEAGITHKIIRYNPDLPSSDLDLGGQLFPERSAAPV